MSYIFSDERAARHFLATLPDHFAPALPGLMALTMERIELIPLHAVKSDQMVLRWVDDDALAESMGVDCTRFGAILEEDELLEMLKIWRDK